jgi:hypothetical protein
MTLNSGQRLIRRRQNNAKFCHSGKWDLEVQLYLFVIWTVDEGESSAASTSLFTLGKESAAPSERDAGGAQEFVWKPRKKGNFLLLLGFEP